MFLYFEIGKSSRIFSLSVFWLFTVELYLFVEQLSGMNISKQHGFSDALDNRINELLIFVFEIFYICN